MDYFDLAATLARHEGRELGAAKCCECGDDLPEKVLKSPGGGYYVGTWCPKHGPHSRVSGYYTTKEEAEREVDDASRL
jgi:hypothetical protein